MSEGLQTSCSSLALVPFSRASSIPNGVKIVKARLERRCLLKHTCKCHELLQLTLLGAASARDKARGLEALMDLQEALRAAELRVAKAERDALRLLDEGYWD
jgi:hypothetical protein